MKEGDAFVAVLARKGTLNIETETETESQRQRVRDRYREIDHTHYRIARRD